MARTARPGASRRPGFAAPPAADLAEAALDAALGLAAARGWARVRLHDVADALGVPLAELSRRVPDLDALGHLLLARADRAMLAVRAAPGFAALPARDRLFLALAAWFDTLAPHRDAVRAMMAYKLKPAHLHLQAALIVRLSRTVQWWREAAHLDAPGRRQEVEEIGLSALLVAAVAGWLRRPDPGAARTKAALRRRLARADRLMAAWTSAARPLAQGPSARR